MVALLILFCLAGCHTFGRHHTSYIQTGLNKRGYVQEGVASWYGNEYNGRSTACGEVFDETELTAAHKEFPFQTIVKVTNLLNGRTVTVRINDRGPFIDGRVIDLSKAAAHQLGMNPIGCCTGTYRSTEMGVRDAA